MIKLLLALVLIAVFASCAVITPRRHCQPSPRSKDYAGQQVKTKLVAVHRTMRGYKHFFVTDSNDTITRYMRYRFTVDSCYTLTM